MEPCVCVFPSSVPGCVYIRPVILLVGVYSRYLAVFSRSGVLVYLSLKCFPLLVLVQIMPRVVLSLRERKVRHPAQCSLVLLRYFFKRMEFVQTMDFRAERNRLETALRKNSEIT